MGIAMREIILDTETTGLDAASGDRIVEIACLELENRIPTGSHFQRYINPERDMPEGAFRIHGSTGSARIFWPATRSSPNLWTTFWRSSPTIPW
jgi:hypothetical protein